MDKIYSGHLQSIDVLRGVAIAAVIVYHFYGAAFGADHPEYRGFWIDVQARSGSWWLLYPLAFGWAGVALFFVISGYVIHRSYLLDRHFTWSGYAWRRFWRIYPAYIVMLIGFTFWQGVPFVSRDFVLHLLLIHNLNDTTFFGSINPSFWSLAVECQLYALYPLAIFARSRFGVRGMLALGCIAAAIWTVGSYINSDLPLHSMHLWQSPIALWPDWLLGSVLAEYHNRGKRLFQHPLCWALASGALCSVSYCSRLTLPLVFSLASLSSAALVDAYLLSRKSFDIRLRPLGLLGCCSYSVYLIHQPLVSSFLSLFSAAEIRHPVLKIVIGYPTFLVLILGIGWALYVVVEKGGQRIGKSIATSRVGALSG